MRVSSTSLVLAMALVGITATGRHAQTHVRDVAGRVRIPLSSAGSWHARTIHVRRIAGPSFEWESVWASVTFPVR